MNREILFRAKYNETTWVEGDILSNGGIPVIIKKTNYESVNRNNMQWSINAPAFKIIPETLGQYTGLKDKNGEKIFEGDIVRAKDSFFYNDGNYRIVYERGGFLAEDKNESEEVTFGKDVSLDDFEIIGNIHDNPELLKGE